MKGKKKKKEKKSTLTEISHSLWIIVATVAFLFLAQWSLIPNSRLDWANHGCQYPRPVISDVAPIKLEALNRTWTFAFQLALMWKGGTSRFESHPVWSSQLLAKRAGGRLSAFCRAISYSCKGSLLESLVYFVYELTTPHCVENPPAAWVLGHWKCHF